MKGKMKGLVVGTICLAAIIVGVVIYFTSENYNVDKEYIYNGYSEEWVSESDDFIFVKNINPQIIDKKSGKSLDFDLNPYGKNDNIMPLFSENKRVYYIENNYKNNIVGYRIGYYDEKFNKKIIMKKTLHTEEFEQLFGLIKTSNMNYGQMIDNQSPSQSIIYKNKLYLYGTNKILQYDLITNRSIEIYSGWLGGTSFSYYKGKLYFITEDFQLTYYDIEKKKLAKIKDVKAYDFIVTTQGIIYSDINNRCNLNFVDFASHKKTNITTKKVKGYDFEDGKLFYVTGNGNYYQYDITTHRTKVLLKGRRVGIFNKIKGENKFYVGADGEDGNLQVFCLEF
ncbi:MAG: hypothetical protein RR313_07220 [Anaerovoracaceae bacterium]